MRWCVLLLLLAGCTPTNETTRTTSDIHVQTTRLVVQPPPVVDTLGFTFVSDTVWAVDSPTDDGGAIHIRVHPHAHTVAVNVQPPVQVYHDQDTTDMRVQTDKTVEKGLPFLSKLGISFILVMAAGVVAFLVRLKVL